jgi:hypothetical protein
MPVVGFVPLRAPDRTYKRPVVRMPLPPKPTPFVPYRPGEPVPDPLPPADLGMGFGWVYPVILLVGQLYALRVRKWWDATKREAAAQKWGQLSSRPKAGPTTPLVSFEASGNVGSTGGQVRVMTTATQLQRTCSPTASSKCYGPAITSTQTSVVLTYGAGGGDPVGTTPSNFRICGYDSVTTRIKSSAADAVGTLLASFISSGGVMPACGDIVYYGVFLEYLNPTGTQRKPVLPGVPVSFPSGYAPPQVEVLPQTAPLPGLPAYLPGAPPATAPVVPDADPVPQPETPPAKVPARPAAPVAPPVVRPQVPGSVSTANGSVVAPVQAPAPVTPSDVVFPVPGGAPVGSPGQSPRPDLTGIAQEVGRIERKLEGLLNPKNPTANPAPEWVNDIGDALNFARMVYELFTATQAGGTYTLSSPCVLDESDERIPAEIDYEGGLSWLDVLSNKIDALALLQQAAKDLKQPICRHKAEGQPVTVTFTQQ